MAMLVTWMRGLGLGILLMTVLLISATLPTIAQATNPEPSTQPEAFPSSTWLGWAGVAWSYWNSNNCYNPTTGLDLDACGWHYFTLWGLASNIFATVDAEELGLITETAFAGRVGKVVTFLNSMSLNSNNVPFDLYSSDTGSAASTSLSGFPDYGRLLIAEYVLRQRLLQLGFNLVSLACEVTSAVMRVNNSYFSSGLGGRPDLYGYYASLGFYLWGLIPSTTMSVQSQFDSLIKNGPYVTSGMYGVSGIPADTRIDGEPFIDAILEVGNLPQITGLQSWGDFKQLGGLVYDAQGNRSAVTGKPEFWTGGGLDFLSGFDYEWIEWVTGATWTVLDENNNPITDPRVPVAFFKLAFAYNALYDTTYATNMLNSYASPLQCNNDCQSNGSGFMEGVDATGAYDTNVQVQTNQIILSAAVYATTSTTTTTTSTATTSSTLSCSITSVTVLAPANGTAVTTTYPTLSVNVVTTPTTLEKDAQVSVVVNGIVACPAHNATSVGAWSCSYPVEANGPFTWEPTAEMEVDSVNATPISSAATFTAQTVYGPIPLYAGWNLISLPLIPAANAITSVLASQIAGDNFTVVWSYQGGEWSSATLSNGKLSGPLTTIQDGLGYWIYMTRADNLFVVGNAFLQPTATPPSYSLLAGWNLAGFKPEPTVSPETVGTYLTSISGDYDANAVWIYDNPTRTWIRATGSTSIPIGEALWVYMTTPATLTP